MKNKRDRHTNLDDLIQGGDRVFHSACILLGCLLGGSILLLIAAIITEEGVLLPPFSESIAAAFEARDARRGEAE